MKIKTLNSVYELNDDGLFRNGELLFPKGDIRIIHGITKEFICYEGTPKVGDMLGVVHITDERLKHLKTSIILEVND